MNKEEFLGSLGNALAGNVPQSVIEEQLTYYRSYISEQVANGFAEAEVIEDIGDPRLIAKTIQNASAEPGPSEYLHKESDSDRQQNGWFRCFGLDSWYHKVVLAGIILVVLLLGILFFMVLVRFSIPIIMVVLIIWMLRKFTNTL